MATLSWLNQLRPASFRGVRFYVDSLTNRQGQDVVIREYPFQDLPTFQAMGEGAEEFSIRAYVIGERYMVGRDALADKLRGEGVLIHPTRGAMKCWVKGKFTISENPTAEGGIARFDITFVRAEARRYPHAISNPLLTLLGEITIGIGMVSDWFAQAFKIGQTAGYVVDSIGSDIAHLRQQLHFNLGGDTLAAIGHQPGAVFKSVSETVLNAVQTDINKATKTDKKAVIHREQNVICVTEHLQKMGMGDYLSPVSKPRYATPSRQHEQRLKQRLRGMAQAMAIIGLVQHAILQIERNITKLSYREYHAEAKKVRDAIETIMQLDDSEMIRLQQILHKLEASYLDAMTQVTRAAGRMTTFTPTAETPLAVICYQLYGDLRRYDELRANNPHITHPMFVPQGIPLQVVAA